MLDSSKLKEFADDNFKFDEHGTKLSKLVENTTGKGEIARYEQFLLFPQCFEKACFPVIVAMYLTKLLDQGKSYSVIFAAVYSIQWIHSLHGLENPTNGSIVKNLLEAAKRLRSAPVQKKDVIDTTMLQTLCNMFASTNDICTLRDLSLILLGFSGFM